MNERCKRYGFGGFEPTKTMAQFADDQNVNSIMQRYNRTGVLPLSSDSPLYADVSNVGSYQDAMDVVLAAQQAFECLPAKTRDRFGNDPQRLIAFLADAQNDREAVKLGLKEERPVAPKSIGAEVGEAVSAALKQSGVGSAQSGT